MNESKEAIHKPHRLLRRRERRRASVEVAMQWNTSYAESVFSFANNINTHEGGTHIAGVPLRADPHDQQVRARQGAPEGEGGQPRGRGHPRGPRRGRSRSSSGTRSSRGRRRRSSGTRRSRAWSRRRECSGSRSSSRRTHRGAKQIVLKAVAAPAHARQPEGARPHAPQERAVGLVPPRQARRLPAQGPGLVRALHRRG